MPISTLRSPGYAQEWTKYRWTWRGGRDFKRLYLKKYSQQETDPEFSARQAMTYNPPFASLAITKIVNAFSQRMDDVARTSKCQSYQDCVSGLEKGVDYLDSPMNKFMIEQVVPELCVMGKVGVFVDMAAQVEATMYMNENKHPYLYMYVAEEILAWNYVQGKITSLLVVAKVPKYEFDLLVDYYDEYRYYTIEPQGLLIQKFTYRPGSDHTPEQEELVDEKRIPGLWEIPFVLFQLDKSLLTDAADYQIALLNMESSDVNFCIQSNFPFYTEQFNPVAEQMYNYGEREQPFAPGPGISPIETQGQHWIAAGPPDASVKVGVSRGRRYPLNSERPGFIAPSSEPLKASMLKQAQIKDDIEKVVQVNLATVKSQHASADSKKMDEISVEAGLNLIASVLAVGETRLAKLWTYYTGENHKLNLDAIKVVYPENMSMETTGTRRDAAKATLELVPKFPSLTAKKQLVKQAATLIFEDQLEKIIEEIDSSAGVGGDPVDLERDVKNGLVDKPSASELRGYKPGLAKKAYDAHIAEMAAIYAAQVKADPNIQVTDRLNANSNDPENVRYTETLPKPNGLPKPIPGKENGQAGPVTGNPDPMSKETK